MPGSSILPVALHKGKLFFLFGKENPMEDSAPGFSDFGGGVEAGETEYETAVREGGEELTGFLGDGDHIKQYIKTVGGPYILTREDPETPKRNYTVHIIPVKYDTMLPVYYNNNHAFLWNKMDKRELNATKLFEKIEIDWFSESDLRKRMSEYRSFYQEVVKLIITHLPKIKKFIKKRQTNTKRAIMRKMTYGGKTKKQRGG